MTFQGYINNPMGRKNMVFSNKDMYRELYTKKLDAILLRERGSVEYTMYTSKDNYYIHFKIPSEVVENFYYDTVVEFSTKDSTARSSRSISEYDVKFFSNDPSFVFTFAYAFLSNNLFIKDLVPRMSKEAVKKVAKERNPGKEVGYVKSLYFAFLIMKRDGLFNKIKFESYGKKYNKKELLKNIMHSDEKVELRREEGDKVVKHKRAEKNKPKRSTIENIKQVITSVRPNNKTNRVSSTKRAKRSKKI